MRNMAADDPTSPIPVRLTKSVISRLDAAAKNMGTNRAALIRFLVQTFSADFLRRGLKALPHDWQEVMRRLDGRTADHAASMAVAEDATPTVIPLKKIREVKYTADKAKKTKAKHLP